MTRKIETLCIWISTLLPPTRSVLRAKIARPGKSRTVRALSGFRK